MKLVFIVVLFVCTMFSVNSQTVAVPACVTGLSPANGSVLTTQSTTLTWQASPGATSYDVYFGEGTTAPTGVVATITGLSYNPGILPASRTYSWAVVPRNAIGENTACLTNSATFTTAPLGHVRGVSNAGPDVTLTLPVSYLSLDASASTGSIVQYYWYQVQGPVQAVIIGPLELISSAAGLTTAGKYIFGLQVKDNDGALTYSYKTVTVNPAVPSCVTGLSPANGSVLTTQSTTLTWQASPGATSYDVYFGEGTTAPTGLVATITGLNYNPGILPASRTYSWAVVPRNANGENTACLTNSATFTTAPLGHVRGVSNAGPDVTLTLPVSYLSLDASASTGSIVQYYWYQVQGPVQAVIIGPLELISSAAGLTTAGKYIFGLQVKDNDGALTYSYKTVTVNPAVPSCVTGLSPANGSVLTTQSTTLTWQVSPGATFYDVYFGEGTTAPTGVVATITGLSYNPGILPASRTYSWAVVPRNANGENTACLTNSATFTTAPLGHVRGVSNAGPDVTFTLPVSYLSLDASASTGSIVQYYWYQVQGPVQAVIIGPLELISSAAGLTTAGKYVFGLQVKDNDGALTYSYKTVTVNPASVTTASVMDAPANATGTAISKTADNSSLPSISAVVGPNPVTGGSQATLQINSSKAGVVMVNTFNSNGAIIGTKKVNLAAGFNTTTIGTAGLAPGFNVISITGSAKPLNLKLIIQ